MVELRGDLHLTQEPVGTQRSGQFGPHDLDRHLSLVLQVLGQVHRGHPALTDHTVDPVTLGQHPAHLGHLELSGGHRALGHTRLGGSGLAAMHAELRLVRKRVMTRRAGTGRCRHGTPML